MRAKLTGEAVEAGRIGDRPLGRCERLLLGSAEYRPWGASAWSLDADATYSGPRPADSKATYSTPGYTLLNAGVRFRFTLGTTAALLRLRVYNLSNSYGWHVDSSGMQSYEPSRRVMLSLTVGS
jgi:iron complex outermembrane receptor protein